VRQLSGLYTNTHNPHCASLLHIAGRVELQVHTYVKELHHSVCSFLYVPYTRPEISSTAISSGIATNNNWYYTMTFV